jgi:catechol 2,3-dioxygenase-like lactoylglutathione lyase family enzyme
MMPMDWTLEVVVVPVTDVDRAKRFYSEQVGFNLDYDTQASGEIRNVQLTPPGSGCSIVLSTLTLTPIGPVDAPPGSAQGLQLVVTDIQAARDDLTHRGVEVSEIFHFEDGGWVPGRGGRWNSFLFFNDPDGNGWIVQERPASG